MVDTKDHYSGHLIGGSMIEYGTFSFSENLTSVDVPCGFSQVDSMVVTPTVTHGADERYYCDGVVDGGKTTVTRANGTIGNLTFSYLIFGVY